MIIYLFFNFGRFLIFDRICLICGFECFGKYVSPSRDGDCVLFFYLPRIIRTAELPNCDYYQHVVSALYCRIYPRSTLRLMIGPEIRKLIPRASSFLLSPVDAIDRLSYVMACV